MSTREHIAVRVAARWVSAQKELSSRFQMALEGYRQGDISGMIRVLEDLAEFFGLTASSRGATIDAPWFYALGPRQRGRALGFVHEFRGLQQMVNAPQPSLIGRLEALGEEVRWLEGVVDLTGGFEQGPFTIRLMRGVRGEGLSGVLGALGTATRLLHRKFPQVLYGDIFISPRVGGSGPHTIATYLMQGDTLNLSLKAQETVGDVWAICHELGHRYFHRFWKDREAREAFRALSTQTVYEELVFSERDRQQWAEELVEHVQAQREGKPPRFSQRLSDYLSRWHRGEMLDLRDAMQRAVVGGQAEERVAAAFFLQLGPERIRTDRVLQRPLHVTPYGAKAWTENFAEAFAAFVTGKKPLPAPLKEIMRDLR